MYYPKNVIFTGVTSGIGLSLVEGVTDQLCQHGNVHLCITCRNMEKGTNLKRVLETKFPSAKVTLVKMDVGSIKSVLQACKEIKQKFTSVDCMYLNAGIMPTQGVEWKHIVTSVVFDKGPVAMFRTGHGMYKTQHYINGEGVNNVFATNVLGHFTLVEELFSLLIPKSDNETTRIFWTTSAAANIEHFQLDDVTGNNSLNAYANSKYVMESVIYEMNRMYSSKGIYSYACDPGIVLTNIIRALLPFWFVYILYPIMLLARLALPSFTLTPHNACHSFLCCLREDLDPAYRYSSRTNFLNQNYVAKEKLASSEAANIFNEVFKLYKKSITEFRPTEI